MRAFVAMAILAITLLASPLSARAVVSPQPGDTCTAGQTGYFTTNAGSLQQPGLFLVCDGAHWNVFLGFTTAGSVGIGTSTPAAKLDVQDGNIGLLLGADTGAGTRTNSTSKIGRFGFPHYTNAQAPFAGLVGVSTSTDNEVYLGGGSVLMNAATVLHFYTGATDTTANGTERMTVTSGGSVGINNTSPATKLDVVGTVRVADGGETCAAGVKGGIRYTSTNILQYCNSTAWQTLGTAGGGAALSSITAATAGNTIANANNAQVWNWNTLTTGNGLTLGSTSVTSGAVLNVASTNTAQTGAVLLATSASTDATASASAIDGTITGSGNAAWGIYGANTGSANTGGAIIGLNTSTDTTNSAIGIYGKISGAGNNGTGVLGRNSSTTNNGVGVTGQSDSVNTATGVFGIENGTANTGYGVQGYNNSAAGYGVYSQGAFKVVPAAMTVASATNAEFTTGTFTAPTITFTGTTAVTGLMDSFIFNPPTFAGTAAPVTGASTITISGAPVKGGSMTLANSYALKILGGAISTATNGYGLYVDAPTGATNNYAAVFASGTVGIGTTSPLATLDVAPSGGGFLDVRDSAGVAGTLRMANIGGTNYIESGVATTSGSAAPIYFTDMLAAHTWMIIGSSGNVGIGATAAVDPLSITTAINASATHALFNLSNTALSGGSASGTYIGANPASFSGDFFNFEVGGASKASLSNAGVLTVQSCVGCSAAATALSSITAAAAGNIIANANNAQVWNWDTLTTGYGLTLGSTSVTSGSILNVASTNATASSGAITGSQSGAGNTGYGVRGINTSTTGANQGVYGSVVSTNSGAVGVYGIDSAATGSGTGVYGYSLSTGNASGVTGSMGAANNTGVGVYGSNTSPLGTGMYSYGALDVAPANMALANGAAVDYNTAAFTAPTLTIGSTHVTSLMSSYLFTPPTLTRGSAVPVDGAATMTITGAPLSGGLVTLSNTYGLKINAAAVSGGAATTNAYGLYVDAPTGATKNYGAVFNTGNVGIGATTPVDPFSLGAAVPSGATHALFNLSNTALSGGSASGTYIGANPASFSGDFFNFEVGGASKASLSNAGVLTVQSCVGCGAGGTALSSITAATAGNTIANANFAQEWDWDTLTTGNALTLGSASMTSGTILNIVNTHASSSGAAFSSTTGSTSTGLAVYGLNNGAGNTGTAGFFQNTGGVAGVSKGVYGGTNATGQGKGVQGEESGNNNTGAGVWGMNDPGTNTTASYGGYFYTTSTGAGTGAYGEDTGAANTGYGLYGRNASAAGYGVYSEGALKVAPAGMTIASNASANFPTAAIIPPTLTLTGTTHVTGEMYAIDFGAETITDASTIAVDNAANMYVAGPVNGGGSATIGNAYGLHIGNAGSLSNVTAAYGLYVNSPSGAGVNYSAVFSGNTAVGNATTNGLFAVNPWPPTVASNATANYISAYFNAPTITLTGATHVTSLMDSFEFNPPTITDSSAATIDGAATVNITGLPLKAGSATLTNTYGLKIGAGAAATATNGYGLYVDAPAAATNNYAAVFASGKVGIGTTAPAQALDVTGNIHSSGYMNAGSYMSAGTANTYGAITASGGTAGFSSVPYNIASLGTITSSTSWSGNGFLFSNTFAGTKAFSMVFDNDNAYFGDALSDTVWAQWTSTGLRLGPYYAPAAVTKLDVVGTIKVGDGGETCSGTYAGGIRYNGGNLQYCNSSAWQTLSTSGGGASTLNGITAATAPQGGLANGNNTIIWNWDALGNGAAMYFGSNGGAGNGQKILQLQAQGVNTNGTVTSYGLYATDTHTGTASTNVGVYASASGATNNYAAIFAAGNVGIGTTGPKSALDVSGGVAIGSYAGSTAAPSNSLIVSGTMGIGTATPVDAGLLSISYSGIANSPIVVTNTDASGRRWALGDNAGTNCAAGKFCIYDDIANSARIAIDSAGNVGIGTTTPLNDLDVESTGDSDMKVEQLGFVGNWPEVLFNGYYNGSVTKYTITETAFAISHDQTANELKLQYAPSGTAGTTISYTDGLLLKSTGEIGIGPTAPVDSLSISDSINASATHALFNLANRAMSGASASGTYIGANPASFSGDFFNFEVGGTSVAKLSNAGALTVTGQLDMGTHKIVNVTDPTAAQDVATKAYVDANSGAPASWTCTRRSASPGSTNFVTVSCTGSEKVITGGCDPNGGTLTASYPTGQGWTCAAQGGVSAITAYANCCK